MSLHIKTAVEQLEESAVAAQLRRGYRALRFEPKLEQEFQTAHLLSSRPQIKLNLVLAMLLITAFALMDRMLLPEDTQRVPDILRFGVMLPLIAALLATAYSDSYTRRYPVIVQIVAPLAGICVAIIQTQAAEHGAHLVFSTLVITTTYLYFLVGMLFYQAFRSNLIVLAAYVVAALLADLPPTDVAYSILVLTLANMVGGVVCYNLETANRTSYLEARLLGEMAARDGLTGIYNRRMFDERVEQLWHQAGREQVRLAMMLIDIDYFKPFNDRYGHQAGDETLRAVAAALSKYARRPLDFEARYGGEEFALVLYDVDKEFVTDLARRARMEVEALSIPHERSSVAPKLTVSIGVACVQPIPNRSHEGMIQLADEALYTAKNQGRNRVVVMESEYGDLKTGAFRAPRKA
ncbi:MAG TPA: diguanylate cyclase [Steroidobacteraceae bacterium]|nr:diguanylate cyclase [Steroidobacteraceae bacterium]